MVPADGAVVDDDVCKRRGSSASRTRWGANSSHTPSPECDGVPLISFKAVKHKSISDQMFFGTGRQRAYLLHFESLLRVAPVYCLAGRWRRDINVHLVVSHVVVGSVCGMSRQGDDEDGREREGSSEESASAPCGVYGP